MKILSIVVPVYNEQDTIREVIDAVSSAVLPANWSREIIVVDDGSTDGTKNVLKEYIQKIRLIIRKDNGGKGAALKDGFKAATGDYILIQDADLEYSISDYSEILKPIDEGKAEIVFGSRSLGKNNVSFSKVYYYGGLFLTKFFNLFFRTRITDLATCYKAFPRKFVDEIVALPHDNFVFDVVELSYFLVRKGVVAEVPIKYRARSKPEGKKMNWRHGLASFADLVKLFVKERMQKAALFLNKSPYARTLLVFSFFCTVFTVMYFSVLTVSTSDDHFFHFRFAELMSERGFFGSFWNFKSLYFSRITGSEYFMYYNFIFYLLIWPLTYIKPIFLAIKLYAVLASALAFTVFYVCIRKFAIKYAFVWTVAIVAITGYPLLWRFFLSRPYTLAPALLCVLLYFLYKKNRIGVFAISFIYLYWHSSTFFFPLLIAVVHYALDRFYYEDKADWKNLLYATLGVVSAVGFSYLIAPGFLIFIKDTVFGIYWETIIGKKVILPEGGEIYPVSFFDYIDANILVFSAFIIAICFEIYQYFNFRIHGFADQSKEIIDRMHLKSSMLLISIGFFMGVVLVSARFGDYFVFFIGIYLILSYDLIFRNLSFKNKALYKSVLVGGAIVIVYLFTNNMVKIQTQIANYGTSPEQFAGIGRWINENTNKGDIIFNADWSWFPQLYYNSPYNNYVTGLEPRFMYVYNPKLFWKWYHITQSGYVCEKYSCLDIDEEQHMEIRTTKTAPTWYKSEGDNIASTILNDFKTKYVMSSVNFGLLNLVLDNNNHFEKVYGKNKDYFMYKVIENPISTSTPKK